MAPHLAGSMDASPTSPPASNMDTNGGGTPGSSSIEEQQPPSKKSRKEMDDERVQRAALFMMKSQLLSVPQAMLCNDFTDAESKDRTLQQRVRRLHSKLLQSSSSGSSSSGSSTTTVNHTATERELDIHITTLATRACHFLTHSTDAFLAVKNCSDILNDTGLFVKLSKREPFAGKLLPGGCYYYTINHSTIVAFTIGAKYIAGNGFKIIGAHTDSPFLKIKPLSKRSGSACVQLGVECYGGGLWHTWFDRDLGITGRVLVRVTNPDTQKEKVEQHMLQIYRPVARVSTLAIHLQTADERNSFKVNKEEHLCPILGTQSVLEASIGKQLNNPGDDDDNNWTKGQEPALMRMIATELGIETNQIANFELGLFDCQPASLGGVKNEFLYSGRLDNLATVFVALETIVNHSKSEDLVEDDMISLVAFFDHEEVGSASAQGAGSPVMKEAVERITAALSANTTTRDPDMHASTVRKSFIISADMAHAVHPNYSSKHEKNHGPKLNAGVALKTNQNQRYATNCISGFIAREIASKAKIPVQEFVVRSDCPCGTTIGPMISAATGIRTVDVGMPQLSMHSVREVMGVADLTHGLNFFQSFFKNFKEIDDNLEG